MNNYITTYNWNVSKTFYKLSYDYLFISTHLWPYLKIQCKICYTEWDFMNSTTNLRYNGFSLDYWSFFLSTLFLYNDLKNVLLNHRKLTEYLKFVSTLQSSSKKYTEIHEPIKTKLRDKFSSQSKYVQRDSPINWPTTWTTQPTHEVTPATHFVSTDIEMTKCHISSKIDNSKDSFLFYHLHMKLFHLWSFKQIPQSQVELS